MEILKINNIPGFGSIKLINSKKQPLDLKKLLTKAEFGYEEVGAKKFQDSRCMYPKIIHLKM